MDIDKEKLKGLLWAEATSYRADCAGWKGNTEALDEFLGDKTVVEVALELLAENVRLCEGAHMRAIRSLRGDCADLIAERDQLKAENEALLSALKGMTSMYGHCWDLVDGGLLCMQDNVQRFEDAHEVAQKVIAITGKGDQCHG
ncbi:hypothetical protein JTY93_15500 [Pseudomonas hygromyciniae]|uniref:Uncharacterized protein n=1 Tax=Pseudomonas hygromyciniae TaxID=2812000 RepID=A0ABX7JQT7_9PSED|nr:hypothetical protein [Pseudomonas hygromyciniae]MBN0975938.1 hypothetical protein [Pseudomonas hygromyciniae]QSB37741.1 hypothetical protein JTY93_15500 [Pseudomonas hygromyciniae]